MFGHRLFVTISLSLLAGLIPVFVYGEPAVADGTLPNGFTQTRFIGGLASPTAMEFAPDGRLFVAEQGGTLRIVKDGQLMTFLDISKKVDARGERGLLGVAFDPDFANNSYVYVYYTRKATRKTPAHNRVVRFTANGDQVVPGSEKLLLRLNRLSSATNHNGGAIHFGKDGELYIAVGENARPSAAQSLGNLLGKMLRINKDGTIPSDNPFYTQATGNNKAIWARGLRNPFSFAVQPGTGRIFINDVGQHKWEEINEEQKGANYGWPTCEGNACTGPEPANYVSPIFTYLHGSSETTGCAITGGAFYNPGTVQFPAEYVGDYFFADFCSGWIRKLDPATNAVEGFKASSGERPVDLKVSQDGDLYFLARGTGSVERIQYTQPAP